MQQVSHFAISFSGGQFSVGFSIGWGKDLDKNNCGRKFLVNLRVVYFLKILKN